MGKSIFPNDLPPGILRDGAKVVSSEGGRSAIAFWEDVIGWRGAGSPTMGYPTMYGIAHESKALRDKAHLLYERIGEQFYSILNAFNGIRRAKDPTSRDFVVFYLYAGNVVQQVQDFMGVLKRFTKCIDPAISLSCLDQQMQSWKKAPMARIHALRNKIVHDFTPMVLQVFSAGGAQTWIPFSYSGKGSSDGEYRLRDWLKELKYRELDDALSRDLSTLLTRTNEFFAAVKGIFSEAQQKGLRLLHDGPQIWLVPKCSVRSVPSLCDEVDPDGNPCGGTLSPVGTSVRCCGKCKCYFVTQA